MVASVPRINVILLAIALTAPIAAQALETPASTPLSPTGVEGEVCPPGIGCYDRDIPMAVDESGDTMTGRLLMNADIVLLGNSSQPANLIVFPGNGVTFNGGQLHGDNLQDLRFGSSRICLANTGILGCNGGDITSVNAGFGLSGGGLSGDVTLDVNPSTMQRRVSGTCAQGSSIRLIEQDGAVICESDDNTPVTAGFGLLLVGNTFDVDGTIIQRRVSSTCAPGNSIRAINVDGSVSCEADDIAGAYTGTLPIDIVGSTISLSTAGCGTGEVWKFTGSGWSCDPDNTSGGTVTSITGGSGLLGGTITTSGTFSLDSTWVQRRVGSGCGVGSSIRSIALDGSVTCEDDTDTTYGAGDGLVLSGTTFAVEPCVSGQVLKYTASWSCGADADTTFLAGGGLTLTGTTFSIPTAGVSSAMVADGTLGLGDLAFDPATQAELDALQAAGTINTPSNPVDWTKLKGVPAGFADGVDAAPGRAVFSKTSVDTANNVGSNVTVTIGVDGFALLAYTDTTNGDLRVAHCADVPCTSATATTLDSTGSVGDSPAITIGSDGLGLIAYKDTTNQDLKVAHCDDLACTSATFAVMDAAIGSAGGNISIAVGTDGFGIVAYYDDVNDDLKAGHCSNVACSSSTNLIVDSLGTTGLYTSIAIGGRLGHPVISYQRAVSDELKLAECTTATCSSVVIDIVDTASSDVGRYTSVTALPHGGLLISYYDFANTALKVAFCAAPASNTNTRECTGTWTTATLDGDQAGASAFGLSTSVAIGADGLPIISYWDQSNQDLKVAHCWAENCTSSSLVTLDSTGNVGQSTAITIGVDGLPLVAYHDTTNGDVKVAHCSNPTCVPFYRPR